MKAITRKVSQSFVCAGWTYDKPSKFHVQGGQKRMRTKLTIAAGIVDVRRPFRPRLLVQLHPLTGQKSLLQIGAYNPDEIFCGFLGRFGIAWYVVAYVVLHQLCHKAIDGSPCGRQPLEHVGTLLVVVQRAQYGLKLTDHFLGAVNQIQFFSRCM
jgi:hypothetical protein